MMSVKRVVGGVITDRNGTRVPIYSDPARPPLMEVPIANRMSDEEAQEFAKKTYSKYAPHTDVEFIN